MKIRDLLSVDTILVDKTHLTKKKLLEKLSHLAAEKTGLDAGVILDALVERERLGTTGIGHGVALPHARLNGLDHIFCGFMKANPTNFEAVDDKPVDLIFVLLVPENAGADHLKALAKLSHLLKDSTTTNALRTAELPKELYQIILENDQDD